jgi:hypothetical protein
MSCISWHGEIEGVSKTSGLVSALLLSDLPCILQRRVFTAASAGYRSQIEDLIQKQRQGLSLAVDSAFRDKALALIQKPDIQAAVEAGLRKNAASSGSARDSEERQTKKPLPPYGVGWRKALEQNAAFHFVHPVTASAIKVPVAADFYWRELKDAGFQRRLPGQADEEEANDDGEVGFRE